MSKSSDRCNCENCRLGRQGAELLSLLSQAADYLRDPEKAASAAAEDLVEEIDSAISKAKAHE